MPTVTSLNNYSFAFNGFVFGGGSSVYQITNVEGLEALPGIRNQDDNRGYFDGMFSGRDFLGGRTIVINMITLSGNGNSAQGNFNLLQAAINPQQSGTTPLQFQLSPVDNLQFVNARVRARATSLDPNYTYGYITSQLTFFCPDPNIYDNTIQTGTMSVSTPLGRTYNRTYNLTYGGGSQTQTLNVTNQGWATTYPQITIKGPIINPVIGNLTTSQALNFNYTMGASDTFVIDLLNRTVLLNGAPARNLLFGTSAWFAAPPGTSQYYFSGLGSAVGVTNATVQWNNAYI